MNKTERKNNLGGLLVLAVISFAITAIVSFTAVSKTVLPFNFNQTWVEISNLSLDSYNKGWINFVYFNFFSIIFILVISTTLFFLFTKQSKYFPTALVIYFMVRLLLLAFTFYFQTVTKGPIAPTLTEVLSAAFRALFIPGIWIPYILLSEKSEEIFIY